jgi:oligosaccharide repeat unit polymerase
MLLLLLVVLGVACVFLVAWGFTGPNRCLRFASLFGGSMAGFVVPQVIGLYNDPDKNYALDGSLQMFITMALLCMIAAVVGDFWGYRRSGRRIRSLADYDWRRIMEAALILNIIAFLAGVVSQVLYGEEIARRTSMVGGMSGAAVIVIFFGSVHRYGFALALLLYWERRSVLALGMIAFGALNYLLTVFLMARRGPAIEFVFIIILTYALGRKKRIAAAFIALLFVIGTFWSTAIADFRSRGDWLEHAETADYMGSLGYLLHHGGLEVQNGCDVISTTYEDQSYEWGKLHWNKLVHGYFPGQIFGYDIKEGLKFEIVDIADQRNRERGTVGATPTGMADCFTTLGFFGCFKYVIMGFFMGRWFRRAFQGDLASRLAYSTLITAALHTISHGTYWVVNEYIHFALFSYPVLYWARKPAAAIDAGRKKRLTGWGAAEPSRDLAAGLR